MPHLGGPAVKVQRAREHLDEFDRRITSFLDDNPVRYERQLDPLNFAYLIYKFSPHPAPPLFLATIVGDIVHNLRSALDHVAWQLALQTTDDPRKTIFPIFANTSKRSMKVFMRAVQFILPDSLAIIEALQPYHRGETATDDPLWTLHALWNADKHRLLTSTTSRLHVPTFTGPGGRTEHLEDGTILLRVPKGSEPEVNLEPYLTREILLEIPDTKMKITANVLLRDIFRIVGHEIVPMFSRYLPEPSGLVDRELGFQKR